MISIILYTTAGCHLCELAEGLLRTVESKHAVKIIHTEIGDNDDLVERYGIRIPVIEFPNGNELGWPFDATDIENTLQQL
jgi:hypothetical protein